MDFFSKATGKLSKRRDNLKHAVDDVAIRIEDGMKANSNFCPDFHLSIRTVGVEEDKCSEML
jgi:hypothetical protein